MTSAPSFIFRRSILSSLLIGITALAIFYELPATALAAPAPVARRVDTVDHINGKDLADPYRWMEGQNNTEFNAWLTAQGAAGRDWLTAPPSPLSIWQTRLSAVSAGTTNHRMQHRSDGRVFFLRLENGKQGVLIERLPDGSEKVLLDPNQADAIGGHASITNFSVSNNGKIIAVNTDRGGNEITTVEFYDTDTGAKLPDQIEHTWSERAVSWLPDDKAVVVRQINPNTGAPDYDPMLNPRIVYHALGTTAAQDVVVVRSGLNTRVPLAPHELTSMTTSPASDWAILAIAGARAEARVCLVRTRDIAKPDARYNCLIDYSDQIQGFDLHGDTLYLQSVKDAPNGQILAIDLTDSAPSLVKAKIIVPEDKTQVLSLFAVAKDALYAKYMNVGLDTFVRVPFAGGAPETVATPFPGASYLVDVDPNADGFAYTLQSFTTPRQFLAYDPATRQTTDLQAGGTSPKDYTALVETDRIEIPSLDGTLIPVTIIKPKGYKANGKAFVIAEAYGAYGVSNQPFFDPITLEWAAAGHIYVLADIRGGGEKGDAWRLAGKGLNKHKGVEDLIATADYMVKQGYAKKSHIGLVGASAGGIIISNAITHYPDHFGAAISHAGLVNALRLSAAPNGPNQFAEFGDPSTQEGFQSLYNMDGYFAIKAGVRYPPVMLDVGLNDNRVAPWMSGKFGAALINAGNKTVIFRTDADSGHFGTSLNQTAAEYADAYTFFEKAFALPVPSTLTAVKRKQR